MSALWLTLSEVADLTGGRLHLADPAELVTAPVVIDNRIVEPGGLFAAFVGEKVDGHDFAESAVAAGAVAVLGSRATAVPTVIVDDVQRALQALAREVVRRRRAQPEPFTVMALTGSQGKTSTKDLLARVLAEAAPTVATQGSFNNELGLPLTALRTTAETRYLVLEMGARGVGHIAELCDVTAPDIAVVLNVGVAHLGEFGSREAIAQAKGELVEAVRPGGAAVLNADDPLVAAMASRTAEIVRTFAHHNPAWLRWDLVDLDALGRPTVSLTTGAQTAQAALQLVGAHHAANAAAATSAALSAGLGLDQIVEALAMITSISRWRMELHEPAPGLLVLNDAYNANPDSMAAALRTLADMGRRTTSKTVAVLGEMRELGDSARVQHEAIGTLTDQLEIDTVVVVGEGAEGIAAACRSPRRAPDVATAVEMVREDVGSGPAIVLVKASRGAALERVSDALVGLWSEGKVQD
ncbi:MAG TPA: UDP-N-acetylmuramoyl-tripeptide--D-alanyl-D-alanine ligase [Marmoricola sp.]|nr:UDP-N-acetylmuramoyl-tripeptide--D-alanyl-D-alanine ligase [Marmoricola sp.]